MQVEHPTTPRALEEARDLAHQRAAGHKRMPSEEAAGEAELRGSSGACGMNKIPTRGMSTIFRSPGSQERRLHLQKARATCEGLRQNKKQLGPTTLRRMVRKNGWEGTVLHVQVLRDKGKGRGRGHQSI